MKIKVACIQMEAHDLGDAPGAVGRALRLIDEAARKGAQLIILPECTYPAYFLSRLPHDYHHEKGLGRFQRAARELGVYICIGMAEATEGGLFNSAFLIDPKGRIIASCGISTTSGSGSGIPSMSGRPSWAESGLWSAPMGGCPRWLGP